MENLIRFTGQIGLETGKIELRRLVRVDGKYWHLLVNECFFGTFYIKFGNWAFLPQKPEYVLNKEDFGALIAKIQECYH